MRETEYLCFGDFLLRRPLPTVDDEQDEECDLLPLSLLLPSCRTKTEDEFHLMNGWRDLLPG
jgi:hypothetical protein